MTSRFLASNETLHYGSPFTKNIRSTSLQKHILYEIKKNYNLFIFNLCVLVFCLHVLPYLCEGVRYPGTGVTNSNFNYCHLGAGKSSQCC